MSLFSSENSTCVNVPKDNGCMICEYVRARKCFQIVFGTICYTSIVWWMSSGRSFYTLQTGAYWQVHNPNISGVRTVLTRRRTRRSPGASPEPHSKSVFIKTVVIFYCFITLIKAVNFIVIERCFVSGQYLSTVLLYDMTCGVTTGWRRWQNTKGPGPVGPTGAPRHGT
jgi:hypothetical protein